MGIEQARVEDQIRNFFRGGEAAIPTECLYGEMAEILTGEVPEEDIMYEPIYIRLVHKAIACPYCNGTGYKDFVADADTGECLHCKGTGVK